VKQAIYTRDESGFGVNWVERPLRSRQHSDNFDCPIGWGWPLRSITLVCPFCNEVWAILTAEDQPKHNLVPAPCERHPDDDLFIPGSILGNLWLPEETDYDLLPLLPPALLEREARLHLRYLCQTQSNPGTTSVSNPLESAHAIFSRAAEEIGASLIASSTSELPSATSARQPSESPSL
jgi:hypothetical protein